MAHASTTDPSAALQDAAPARTPPASRVVVASLEPFGLWRAERDDPSPRPRASIDERDRVLHPNAAARAAGVRPGMPLTGARQHAPELGVHPRSDPDALAAWEAFLEEVFTLSPRLCALRPGVVAFAGSEADARQFAQAYGARVGVAGGLEEAHLLAYTADAGTVSAPADPWSRLAAAPTYLLRGVGLSRENDARLGWLGVRTLGALRAWSSRQILAFLGEDARRLLPYLKGPGRARLPVHAPPATVRASIAFADPAREPRELGPALERLSRRITEALGERSAGRLTVEATALGMASRASRRLKQPTRDPAALLRCAELALRDTGAVPLGLDGIALIASGLDRRGVQGGLWSQRERLEAAVRDVDERFPGQARRFLEAEPDALALRRRFCLVNARTLEPLEAAGHEAEAGDAAFPDAPAPSRRAPSERELRRLAASLLGPDAPAHAGLLRGELLAPQEALHAA